MQEHHYAFDVDASPEDLWEVFWYHGPDKPRTPGVTIEILHPGNEIGNGLVRHCHFPVPKWLGSKGVGQSWEWLTEVKPYESWRYDAVGKPLWSRATGFTRLEPIARVHNASYDVVSRAESASPATGSHKAHVIEERQILDLAFGPRTS